MDEAAGDSLAQPLINESITDPDKAPQRISRPHYPNRTRQWHPAAVAPVRPRLIYDQHRCKVCAPPLAVSFAASVLFTLGCLLLALPIGGSSDLVLIAGCAFTAAGAVMPVLAFCTCIACKTPSRTRRMREGLLADALLEELMAGAVLHEHYDCLGAENAAAGTVVLLAGAACPRITQRRFAQAVASRFRAIIIDLPGHGSLVSVAFSLRRCERLLNRILERELGLAPEATDAAVAATEVSGVRESGKEGARARVCVCVCVCVLGGNAASCFTPEFKCP